MMILSKEQIIALHTQLISETGGTDGYGINFITKGFDSTSRTGYWREADAVCRKDSSIGRC